MRFEETTPMGSAVAVPMRDPRGQSIACSALFGVLMQLGWQCIAASLPGILVTASEIFGLGSTLAAEASGVP